MIDQIVKKKVKEISLQQVKFVKEKILFYIFDGIMRKCYDILEGTRKVREESKLLINQLDVITKTKVIQLPIEEH